MNALLSPERPASSLFQEVNALLDLLESLGQLPLLPDQDISKGETQTVHGLALSPHAAALCAKDFVRTVQFMRGAYQAVCAQYLKNSARPVTLLYVGCGPYAFLVLPLMLSLKPQQVQIRLIDIHVKSIDSVMRIAEHLGLQPYIAEITTIDAAHYQIESAQKPDIILLEVMQANLEKEPQLALSRHMMQQAPDALLIPEQIRVSLCLLDMDEELSTQSSNDQVNSLEHRRFDLGSILCVDRQSIHTWETIEGRHLPAARLQIPSEVPRGYSPMLLTTITVYQNILLNTYDSGLTCPRRFNADFSAGDYLNFTYQLGANPKLTVEVEPMFTSTNNYHD
ncbi:SAM-dependent methyltransferase [Undibacterium flavidum]|uniref:hypothetical protein n=1 Tax=Undibacterium flavidum TaxID=2762297 RepID=UPI001C9BA386|nr:hypothetical protein [Undibacterium flavidum]